jgi:lipid-A-disaccharide synthase
MRQPVPSAMRTEGPRRVMLVAGEASGDAHGAHLVQALRRMDPALTFWGIGGQAMRDAGVHRAVDAAELAVVGISEVLSQLPAIYRGFRKARRMLCDLAPHLLVLIDFPEFNLRLAAVARRLGIPVLYYISPQIWAWRRRRVHQIGRRVDHMAVILPFEAQFYRRHGIPVTFVGHPLMDRQWPSDERPAGAGRTIGLLPGSRNSEVRRLLPLLLEAARQMQHQCPELRVLLSQADSVDRHLVQRIRGQVVGPGQLEVVRNTEAIFRRADLVVAASGTVTLEAAICGVPMIIVYRVSPLSYRLGKALIRVPHIGLVNLIAGRGVVPELVQADADPRRVARCALDLLADPARLEGMRQELARVRRRLGAAGASERVAGLALAIMRPYVDRGARCDGSGSCRPLPGESG